MKRLLIHRAAEHGDDRIGKNEIQRRKQHAARHRQHDRIADAFLRLPHFTLAERNADEGAAAVADHHRDGKRHHCERENDGIRRVAVGAEIARVGDKDLVDDVVQRAHQQRGDARDGVAPHQRADALCFQKRI